MNNNIKDSFTSINENELSTINENIKFDAIILQTNFFSKDISSKTTISEENDYISATKQLINKSCRLLKDGGLLFIYGLPNYLSFLGEYLNDNKNDDSYYIFKYWISCEFGANDCLDTIPNSHIGMLMYLKSKSKKNTTPFFINTKFVRIPYSKCKECGQSTKDWGGKKHLINPLGSALSDVWSFTNINIETANEIPDIIIKRISDLLSDGKLLLKVVQTSASFTFKEPLPVIIEKDKEKAILKTNLIINDNCINYLSSLNNDFPNGVFDLAFADPPYNLAKNYSTYQDDLEEKKYIDWCNEWLFGMYNNLKPGGALLVLNIPKWSIYHFNFLADKMIFQNWIVWNALSTPSGKLLPAHYSLLYFIKPGGNPKLNIGKTQFVDSRDYCLRQSCVKSRKIAGNNSKELLTDIWNDLHRIKHRKDRDHHPCQLPTKFMERIITLFTNEGDLVFDPFGGAGTTAIAAKIHNRNYIITDLDPYYVGIAERNIAKVRRNLIGDLVYERDTIIRAKTNSIPKKQIEDNYISLCEEHGKILSIDELKAIDSNLYVMTEKYPGNIKKLQSLTKRLLEAKKLCK